MDEKAPADVGEFAIDVKSLLEAIKARRARRRPESAEATRDRAAVDGDEADDPITASVEEAQRRAGWAAHIVVSTPLAMDLARGALAQVNSARQWGWLNRCLEAVFDGYELACELTGVGGRGFGRVLGRGGSVWRLTTYGTRGGAALSAGPLAGVVAAIVDEALATREAMEPSLRGELERAVANAVAAGIILHVEENGVIHPAFIAALATVQRASFERPVAPVEVPPHRAPPNPTLVDAILAAPDDDGPRLVYADWLSEHQDPRGELIQLQCSLASGVGDTTAIDAMRARERALLSRYERLWLAETPLLGSWHWRRGFVAAAVADASSFARALPLLARTPLERIQLTDARRAKLDAFDGAPRPPALHSVDLSPNHLDPRGLSILGAACFARVRSLDLATTRLDNVDGARALARFGATTLGELQRLRLNGTRLSDAGLEALAAAPFYPRLLRLDLRRTLIATRRAAEALVRASALVELDLGEVPLGEESAATLAADAPPSLRTIALTLDAVTGRALSALRARFELVPALPGF